MGPDVDTLVLALRLHPEDHPRVPASAGLHRDVHLDHAVLEDDILQLRVALEGLSPEVLDDLGCDPRLNFILIFAFSVAVSAAITFWLEQPTTRFLRSKWASYKAWRGEQTGSIWVNLLRTRTTK